MLFHKEVEDYPPMKANLALIDKFCELNDKNYRFVCYVNTAGETILVQRKSWNPQMPAYTFSRVHKISDIILKKERHLTDVIRIGDSSKDQAFYYQIHFSEDLNVWVFAYERYFQWHQNRKSKQSAITSMAATSNCNKAEIVSGWSSSHVASKVLWNKADCQFSTRSNSVSSSLDLSSHLATPVRNNCLSNLFSQDYTIVNSEEDLSSSPEPQESNGFDLDNVSINEEGERSEEQVEPTSSLALEACNPSSDDFVIVSSYSSEEQVIPDDDKIHTLDTVVCNMGHSYNESTSLTREVEIVMQSEGTISNAMSHSGADPATNSSMTVQAGLPYVLSDNNEDITTRPLTPTMSVPTIKQEKRVTMAGHGSALTLPKRNLVSKLFHRRTTSSVSDINDTHNDMDTPETPKLFKKKLYQLDSKMVAAQLALLDGDLLTQNKKLKIIKRKNLKINQNKYSDCPCYFLLFLFYFVHQMPL